MSKASIKHKLKSVRWTSLKIQTYSEELERLRSFATKCTPAYSQTPGGGGFTDDKLPTVVIKCMEVEALLNEEIAKHNTVFIEVHEMISKVNNHELQTLLNKRYLNFEKWEEIADDMCFSLQHVYYLHNQALDELFRITEPITEPIIPLLREVKSK